MFCIVTLFPSIPKMKKLKINTISSTMSTAKTTDMTAQMADKILARFCKDSKQIQAYLTEVAGELGMSRSTVASVDVSRLADFVKVVGHEVVDHELTEERVLKLTFDEAYQLRENQGLHDSLGGCEYKRLRSEWRRRGPPALFLCGGDAKKFISDLEEAIVRDDRKDDDESEEESSDDEESDDESQVEWTFLCCGKDLDLDVSCATCGMWCCRCEGDDTYHKKSKKMCKHCNVSQPTKSA